MGQMRHIAPSGRVSHTPPSFKVRVPVVPGDCCYLYASNQPECQRNSCCLPQGFFQMAFAAVGRRGVYPGNQGPDSPARCAGIQSAPSPQLLRGCGKKGLQRCSFILPPRTDFQRQFDEFCPVSAHFVFDARLAKNSRDAWAR